jgi:hypothetical protein
MCFKHEKVDRHVHGAVRTQVFSTLDLCHFPSISPIKNLVHDEFIIKSLEFSLLCVCPNVRSIS